MNRRDVLKWHREERASLVRQIDALASGRLRATESVDGVMVDHSDEAIAELRRRLVKLDEYLGQEAAAPPLRE